MPIDQFKIDWAMVKMASRNRGKKGPPPSDSSSGASTPQPTGPRMTDKENKKIARKQFEKLPKSWAKNVKIDFSEYTEGQLQQKPRKGNLYGCLVPIINDLSRPTFTLYTNIYEIEATKI